MQNTKTLLEGKTMNVSEAAFFIDYNNVSRLCTEFKNGSAVLRERFEFTKSGKTLISFFITT